MRIPRSSLFTPADSPEMMRKAIDTEADACIFDLEDAIPKEGQERARDNLRDVLASIDRGDKRIYTRIEGTDTGYWLEDLGASIEAGVDGVCIPKVETARDVALVTEAARQLSSRPLEFKVTIESPAGLFAGEEIARYCEERDSVTGLSFGLADYCREIGAPTIDEAVRDFVSQLLLGYAAIGNMHASAPGGTFDIDDLDRLGELSARQRRMGFVGKGCIHPKQVAVINRAFTPSEGEYTRAKQLVETYDDHDRDSLVADGVFLDTATVDRYRDIVARYEQFHDHFE